MSPPESATRFRVRRTLATPLRVDKSQPAGGQPDADPLAPGQFQPVRLHPVGEHHEPFTLAGQLQGLGATQPAGGQRDPGRRGRPRLPDEPAQRLLLRYVTVACTVTSAKSLVRAWNSSGSSRSSTGTSLSTAVNGRYQNDCPMPSCFTSPRTTWRTQLVGAPRRCRRNALRVTSAMSFTLPGYIVNKTIWLWDTSLQDGEK